MTGVMAAASAPADNAGMHGHGEYKMPGGKLVVADVAIAGGKLAQVALSGDFFLEPDEALDAINAALAGQSADADATALAAAVQAALPSQVRPLWQGRSLPLARRQWAHGRTSTRLPTT